MSEELRLARWLTGCTWAKGSRMLEVMEAARLSDSTSTRLVRKLWGRMMQHKKDGWFGPGFIEELDRNFERGVYTWIDRLDREQRLWSL